MSSLIDLNRVVVTAMRTIITDPISTSRSGNDKFIYYRRPKATPQFPFIAVSVGPFKVEPAGLYEGAVTGYSSTAQLLSGTGSKTSFTLTTLPREIVSVEYPIGTVLERQNEWTFLSPDTINIYSAPASGTNNVKVNCIDNDEEDIAYTYTASLPYTAVVFSAANSKIAVGASTYSDHLLMEYLTGLFAEKWKALEDELSESGLIDFVGSPTIGAFIYDDATMLYSAPISFTIDGKIVTQESDIATVYKIASLEINTDVDGTIEQNIVT